MRLVYNLMRRRGRLAGGDLGAPASERSGPRAARPSARVEQMADYLVAALERHRAFVADVSHELRNPLATLRLRLEALALNARDDDARDARLALGEADRLAAVVNRLLQLARAEATAAEQLDFDVVALAQERLAAWAPALRAVDISPRIDAPAEAVARSSPDAVCYALDVVLDNARKFAPGAPLDVAVTVRGEHVDVTVRDHGAGLPRADLDRAGERFWRSSSHRAVAGTGLGLATSRALLESAGATLHVSLGAPGLLVVLRLPASTGAILDTSAPRPNATAADRPSAHHAD